MSCVANFVVRPVMFVNSLLTKTSLYLSYFITSRAVPQLFSFFLCPQFYVLAISPVQYDIIQQKGTKKGSSAWELPFGYKNGAPRRIRTHDLLVRSQTLYPAELVARKWRRDASIRQELLPLEQHDGNYTDKRRNLQEQFAKNKLSDNFLCVCSGLPFLMWCIFRIDDV